MNIEYLSSTAEEWEAILDEIPHDVYHLPQYLEVSARYEGGEPLAFCAREKDSLCLIPVLMRRLPDSLGASSDWRDLKSPYGYAAPLFRGDDSWICRAFTAFSQECRTRNIVSVFLYMHPLISIPPNLTRHGQLVKHGQTVYVDLNLSDAELWSQTRTRFRSYINRLQRAGFQVHFDDWSAYDEFVSVYRQTMARLHADTFYQWPVQYFFDLRSALGSRLHFCSVFDSQDAFACGALFTETQGIVQYHLSGTAEQFISDAPSKLMLHEASLWAKREGHRVLHLGGGVGGRADSLFHFKAGFSSLRADFLTYRMVCDESKYASLCRQNGAEPLHNAYFPQYRRSS